jgi:hypothetical protein
VHDQGAAKPENEDPCNDNQDAPLPPVRRLCSRRRCSSAQGSVTRVLPSDASSGVLIARTQLAVSGIPEHDERPFHLRGTCSPLAGRVDRVGLCTHVAADKALSDPLA